MAQKRGTEIIEFEVTNWDKYNPRNDVKHNWWFRNDNDMPEDPKIRQLTPFEKWMFICLLGLRSKSGRNKTQVGLSLTTARSQARNNSETIRALNALARYGLVTWTYQHITLQDITKQNKTKEKEEIQKEMPEQPSQMSGLSVIKNNLPEEVNRFMPVRLGGTLNKEKKLAVVETPALTADDLPF